MSFQWILVSFGQRGVSEYRNINLYKMTPWVRVQYKVRKSVFLIQTSKKRHYNEQIKVKWYWSVVVIDFLQDRKQFLWNQCFIKNLMMAHIILITIRPSDFFSDLELQSCSYRAHCSFDIQFWLLSACLTANFTAKIKVTQLKWINTLIRSTFCRSLIKDIISK